MDTDKLYHIIKSVCKYIINPIQKKKKKKKVLCIWFCMNSISDPVIKRAQKISKIHLITKNLRPCFKKEASL